MEIYTTITPGKVPVLPVSNSSSTISIAFESGNIAWVLTSTALVWLMIPGVGYFYSGMGKSKHALSLIMLSCWSIAVVSIQWFLFGYSLTFSRKGSFFVGNLDNAFLWSTMEAASIASEKVPDLVFCIYQAMFAAITPALAIGAAAERGRFLPTIVFIFIWTTFVYDFIAYWTWNPNGWSNKMGGLDYAGGTPVHIASGSSALAFALILGFRAKDGEESSTPHNMANVVLGTAFLWFGWFGFNGGSALAASLRAVVAAVNTNLAASAGGITWTLMDFRHEKKFSATGFCCGVVAGLVAVTPACGYVSPASSLIFGVVGAIACNFGLNLNRLLKFDDAMDVFALHGIGGLTGNILTGIFADKKIAALDGQVIEGGWINGHWMQVVYQLADSCAGLAWSFSITYFILFFMNKMPGLALRASQSVEMSGLDKAEMGVPCYYYVENIKSNEMYACQPATAKTATDAGKTCEINKDVLECSPSSSAQALK